jgi:hypothetical protein
MTFGRTLKKALLQCGQSPGFSVWSKVAADRVEWKKLRGQIARFLVPVLCTSHHRMNSTKYRGPKWCDDENT